VSSFNNPNILDNVIPIDENGSSVAVLFYYDPVTKKYFPVDFDGGVQVVANGPRTSNYQMMHNAITVADTVIPVAKLGLFDLTGFSNMSIDIKLVGVGSYVTLLPLYWNPLTLMYHQGQSEKFTSNLRVYADANDDIYLLPIEVQGTVTIVIAGA
jgi:hypothetical protein